MSLIPAWAPNLHPLLVHFPVTLLLCAVAVDMASLIIPARPALRDTATLFYCAGALLAMAAYFRERGADGALHLGGSHHVVLCLLRVAPNSVLLHLETDRQLGSSRCAPGGARGDRHADGDRRARRPTRVPPWSRCRHRTLPRRTAVDHTRRSVMHVRRRTAVRTNCRLSHRALRMDGTLRTRCHG